MPTRLTFEIFEEKTISKFGDGFDLSEVNYINNKTPIIITCPKGHRFERKPYEFLNSKYGCSICGRIAIGDYYRWNNEKFIEEARKVHGDFYDYSDSLYKSMHEDVIINCPIHGPFSQPPHAHIRGNGCKECWEERRGDSLRWTKEDFIRKAREVHGWLYDYSQIEYIDSITEVTIICPKHGPFSQIPASHIQGHGCPKCKASKGERAILRWLEENNIPYIHEYRINPNQMRLIGRKYYLIDFFLPSLKIAIEFHGKQHFEYVPAFHRKEDTFEEQQIRDKELREYCKTNGIKLIEIPYYDEDKIPSILAKKIK